MGKREEIFLGTCIHIAKEALFYKRKFLETPEQIKELFDLAEAIFKEGYKREFLDLYEKLENEKFKK